MSDKVRALVWSFYEEELGAKMITMIALADEADDRGGGIFQSVSELAKKTRQTRQGLQKQLRALEVSGLLECVERSSGGPGNFSHYRLVLGRFLGSDNGKPGLQLGDSQLPTGLAVSNPLTANRVGGSANHCIQGIPTIEVNPTSHDASLFAVTSGDSKPPEDLDLKLAVWMFNRIQAIDPKARKPAWSAWKSDIARMVRIDKRTHREIAELFAWANADPFWMSNIESPRTLRKQWNKLTLKRSTAQRQGMTVAQDRRCVHVLNGERCGAPGVVGQPDGRWHCARCLDLIERDQASGGATA